MSNCDLSPNLIGYIAIGLLFVTIILNWMNEKKKK